MSRTKVVLAAITLSLLVSYLVLAQQPAAQQQPQQPVRFFVTSAGPGMGANLGGLAGADKHCQTLAAAAGAGDRTWRAYLCTQGPGAVNARDRVGNGPWHNVKGQLIANNVADLHGDVQRDRIALHKNSGLSEKGEVINGVGDKPNRHDILTGCDSHGRAFTDAMDHTCNNWTSGETGTAQVGHHDRLGGTTTSWNSAHGSKGCSQQNLISTGGDGLLYCFATN